MHTATWFASWARLRAALAAEGLFTVEDQRAYGRVALPYPQGGLEGATGPRVLVAHSPKDAATRN